MRYYIFYLYNGSKIVTQAKDLEQAIKKADLKGKTKNVKWITISKTEKE